MTPDSALASSFVQARHYTKGPRTKGDIRVLVIHDTESPEVPQGAENVAAWWSTTITQSSAHYIADNNSIVQAVHESDVAWQCPSLNHDGIGVEHCGYAKQQADKIGWGDQYSQDMLRKSAFLFAELCLRWNIPAVYLDAAALKRGERGITTHRQGSIAYKPGGHTDPGMNFPLGQFIDLVKTHMGRSDVIEAALQSTPILGAARLAGVSSGDQISVFGDPFVPAARAEQVINAHHVSGANGYTAADIHLIVNAYYGTCQTVGVNPIVALAQMAHETGWIMSPWSAREQRNPAGIFVTGRWFATDAAAKASGDPYAYVASMLHPSIKRYEQGRSFKSWAPDSIDAHVGRLVAYGLAVGEENEVQRRLIGIANEAKPIPSYVRGVATTLAGLGAHWAVSDTYGARIAARVAEFL